MPRPSRPVTPVTREMFAQLVADLRGELAEAFRLDAEDDGSRHAHLLARQQPGKRRPYPDRGSAGPRWAGQRVTLREAAELTGLSYNSLRVYRARGDQDRAAGRETFRSFPAGLKHGWRIGALALWRATSRTQRLPERPAQGSGEGTRWPGWDTYVPQLRKYVDGLDGRPVSVTAAAAELGVERTLARKLLRHIGALPPRVTDAAALEYLRPLATTESRRVTLQELLDYLDDGGMHMWRPRAIRLYLAAGGREPLEGPADGPDLAPGESMRTDGLLTATQVARWFDVSDAYVSTSRKPRADGLPPLIEPAKWENGRPLYDKTTLTRRNDMRSGPVRKGHPLAKPELDTRQTLKGQAHGLHAPQHDHRHRIRLRHAGRLRGPGAGRGNVPAGTPPGVAAADRGTRRVRHQRVRDLRVHA